MVFGFDTAHLDSASGTNVDHPASTTNPSSVAASTVVGASGPKDGSLTVTSSRGERRM